MVPIGAENGIWEFVKNHLNYYQIVFTQNISRQFENKQGNCFYPQSSKKHEKIRGKSLKLSH